jgi:hypothetical protein
LIEVRLEKWEKISISKLKTKIRNDWGKEFTVDMSESSTLTANAVPQANGCVR